MGTVGRVGSVAKAARGEQLKGWLIGAVKPEPTARRDPPVRREGRGVTVLQAHILRPSRCHSKGFLVSEFRRRCIDC